MNSPAFTGAAGQKPVKWFVGLFFLMPFTPAKKACRFMNTNHFATFWTSPFQCFILNEISDPNFIYHFEIINHTQSILGSVSLIQLLQPGAGETITAIWTIPGFAFSDLFAVSDFACSTVFCLLTLLTIDPEATWTCILFSNKSPTEAAVHSTWCNRICRNRCRLFSACFCHNRSIQFR